MIFLKFSIENLGFKLTKYCSIVLSFRFGFFSPKFDWTKMITYTERFCALQFLTLGCCNNCTIAPVILQKSLEPQCISCSIDSLEIDDDVYFCVYYWFMGDKTSVTNDKSIDINFMVKEEQF